MSRRRRPLSINEPLRHRSHKRPVTRRDFLAQGFLTGAGTVMGTSLFSMFANPRAAMATLSDDVNDKKLGCGIATQGAGKIPFICFDLAGGANIAGSNVLTGGQGGQMDFLTTAAYEKLGIPGDMIPPLLNPQDGTNDFINTDLGLAMHSDSAFLRGMIERLSPEALLKINGAVIPARSDNDTGNNPHNPMYGIAKAGPVPDGEAANKGADGELLTLIGSRSSDSGGNSMAPDSMIDTELRPTKVDRPSDVTGLVDTGKLVGLLDQQDAVAVMESIYRISDRKVDRIDTKVGRDDLIKELMRCGYVKAADLVDRYGDPTTLNPEIDPLIVGDTGIFTQQEFDDEGEFQKTASIMKMVVNGFAGAGTISMGGFDYHTGDRAAGELRDLRAGRCMGACLEYAHQTGVPLMLYVFSDGAVSSNGRIDNSIDGRGKGEWTSDNSSTAASFFLVYDPNGRPTLLGGTPETQARHQQIGWYRSDGSVDTSSSPAANNVNLLVETVLLNYMALHGEQGLFEQAFPNHGLGTPALMDSLTAFEPVVNGVIGG